MAIANANRFYCTTDARNWPAPRFGTAYSGYFYLTYSEGEKMSLLLIIFLVIIAVVVGLGFVIKWLFWVAIALFLIWIITLLWDRIHRR
jgi:hypothetical protein